MKDEHDEKELENQETEKDKDPFRAEKVFGIATLGALGTLGLYFLYQSLGEETKKKVKERLINGFKAALRQE
jgi:hypothetical protein